MRSERHRPTADAARHRPRVVGGGALAGVSSSLWWAGSTIVWEPAKTRLCLAASSPVSRTVAVISRLGDADLDTPAGEARVQRVVVAIDPDQWLLGNPRHPTPVRVDASPGRAAERPLGGQPLGRDTTDRAMRPAVHLLGPAVQLVLEVQVVCEEPARLEVELKEPVLTLELPLRLRITGIEDDPADLQLAAEGQERLARLSRGRRSLTRGPRRASPPAPPAAQGCAPGPRGCPALPCRRSGCPRTPATSTTAS